MSASHLLDVVLTHANVVTIDQRRPRAEAIGIVGESIAWVGTVAEAAELSARRRIDVGGRTVVPGFNDAGHSSTPSCQRLMSSSRAEQSTPSLLWPETSPATIFWFPASTTPGGAKADFIPGRRLGAPQTVAYRFFPQSTVAN